MKKILITISFIFILIFAAVFFAAPVVNDHASKKTADGLARLPLPAHTELVETVHRSGKLSGNGNGMQYFGAILIKSGLSLEELREYYSDFAEHEWECVVEKQTDGNIRAVEHGKLIFMTDIEGDDYYIVYSWGSNHTIFHELDLSGH